MKTYSVIGTRPIRHDGADKVTGRALYGADYNAAGLLHGFILRSPHAHARVRRIDTRKAAAFPGVKAIVTAADLPESADRSVDLGEVEKGFAEPDVVVEHDYHTATVHQGYIEPHNATVLWNNDGRVHIWCSTQGSFVVRDTTACILDLPVSRVKVTPMEIGGGFGGKIPVYLEPVAALLSRKTGQPVKIVMSRKDVFESTGPTPGSYLKVKLGARKDGRITAGQAYLAYEAGAFPGAMVVPGA